MSGRERQRQKKLERHKRRRKSKQSKPDAFAWSKVERSPFGPCWVGAALDDDDEDKPIPSLIHVLASRKVDGRYVASLVLLDRTCLGVKNAMVLRLDDEFEVEMFADRVGETDRLKPCEPSIAQSVVFHALDYASALGFSPHSDFERRIFEPRPDALVDTPLSRREKPLYVAGPNDEVSRIVAQLLSTVGREFDYILQDELEGTEAMLARALLEPVDEPWGDEPSGSDEDTMDEDVSLLRERF